MTLFGSTISEARSCGEPGQIVHGQHDGECTTFSCRVTYSCQPGFDLIGRANRYCQADGTWTPVELPVCVRKCASIHAIHNMASRRLSPSDFGVHLNNLNRSRISLTHQPIDLPLPSKMLRPLNIFQVEKRIEWNYLLFFSSFKLKSFDCEYLPLALSLSNFA